MTAHNPKPVIFLTFANDREDGNRYLRNLAKEARRLQEILLPLDKARRCRLLAMPSVLARQVFDVFQNQSYRNRVAIFHFGGHSDSLRLMLETVQGGPSPLYAGGLAAFLGQQRGLKLVFLNGCSNDTQVQALLDAGVDTVIATTQDIDDAVACEFAARFYTGLAGGATIQGACTEAAGATQGQHGDQPRHLYAVQPDGSRPDKHGWPWRLAYRPGGEDTADWTLLAEPVEDTGADAFLWVNVPPQLPHPLVGRDDFLTDLIHRLIADHSPAQSTEGQGGVGKTALAVALAYHPEIRAHFTDGVLWGGLGTQPDVATIQNTWATALGIDLGDQQQALAWYEQALPMVRQVEDKRGEKPFSPVHEQCSPTCSLVVEGTGF